jgi:hypothetical protein
MEFGQPLKTGTIASIWHGNRGHLYVVAGFEKRAKKITLIRHNCINVDGTIHAATRAAVARRRTSGTLPKSMKKVGYEEFVEGVLVAPKINRIYGDRDINRPALAKFIREDMGSRTIGGLAPSNEIYPSIDITSDARAVTRFA